jgi:hypothetical protein
VTKARHEPWPLNLSSQPLYMTRHTFPATLSVMYIDPSGPTAVPLGRAGASPDAINGLVPLEPVGEDLVRTGILTLHDGLEEDVVASHREWGAVP